MKITITKYDPAIDPAPYTITNEIPFTDKMTLLEAVVQVNENCEFVAYDYSCHGRHCGRCAVMLDGKPALMCATPLTDTNHTVEPLAGQKVIRDLIVDKTDYHNRLAREYVRTRTEPISEEEVEKSEGADILLGRTLATCMRCGMCDAACPVRAVAPSDYAGPSTMVALAFRHLDSYDQSDRILEAVSKGMYHCTECGTCDEVCQRYEIDHLSMWELLRKAAEERELKPSYAK